MEQTIRGVHKGYYTSWVLIMAPCYCAVGAWLASVLCRAFRTARSTALWPIPLLGFLGCVATGLFFTALLGPGLRLVGIDTPESDAWVRGQFREATIMAVVPAIVVVWRQVRKQIAMHSRPGRGTVAAALDLAVLHYGFIFLVQCFVAGQAVAWPMIKRSASWTPEWWQSEALAYLGWMLPVAPAYLVGEVFGTDAGALYLPGWVLAAGSPYLALFLWRRWRARVRRFAEAPPQSLE